MMLRQIVHEFQHGATSAADARALRESSARSTVRLGVVIDATSVYSATAASHIKIPAEKSLLSHLQYVRELLDRGILSYLAWCDTRDMLADALTKGSPDRNRLISSLSGIVYADHALHLWKPKILFKAMETSKS